MSALQKLKAYFGMVPADSDGYDGYDSYDGDYRRDSRDTRDFADYADADDEYETYEEPAAPPVRTRSRGRYRAMDEFDDDEPRPRGRVPAATPAVQGALAVDRPDPVARLRPVPEQSRLPSRDPLSRITTLHPTSYAEARAIGEHYRDGIPVIINLTEMDNADAKRLVDFSAGLAFALRGSMDKVTNKVFLLSPPDVDVTAEDRRRIAEGGLFLRN
ncbi:cell division protein SepF [Amycolatopsis albispora]|uniref:Cell division protein SepF n=1 Tax=Amycolatopsis albispora TaxID=1804986 RepID=A0A344L7A2_9PSEU|nr:cell division protein SepF [Amycolatopsis albispora]AXB43926.1 cell division protein SepF [Amycolatopsis albispora]